LKPSSLRKALKELPKSLDDTYDRILRCIPEEHHAEAEIVFNLLAFSTRPISLEEAAEAVAIDLERNIFDPHDRLRDASSILEICSSLVTLTPFTVTSSNELRFAHYSVKEYLLSDRRSQGSNQTVIIREDTAHQQLSRLCLIYLLSSLDKYSLSQAFASLPYLRYASNNWYIHSQHIQLASNQAVLNLLSSLFTNENVVKLYHVLRMHNPDGWGSDFSRLYLTSLLGFAEICEELLRARVNTEVEIVSYGGHKGIAKFLLQSEVNAQGGHFGNALQAASAGGHAGIVVLLLQSGADVDAQGGHFGNALPAASARGHEGIVGLLLQSGADINAQGGHYGNALQVASAEGHEGIVRLLLQLGADIDAQGGHYGNALQAASAEGHEGIVRLLLQSEADVNAQGGRFGNALQAASAESHEGIVRLLLQSGADIDAPGGIMAMHCRRHRLEVMKG
jgi:Ankyrin repeats (3 copies)